MIYFQKKKYRLYLFSLLAVSGALWALNACSHGASEEGGSESESETLSDPNSPPLAETDAAPAGAQDSGALFLGAGDSAASATPPTPPAGADDATASTANAEPPKDEISRPKKNSKKIARHRTKKAPAPDTSATDATAAQATTLDPIASTGLSIDPTQAPTQMAANQAAAPIDPAPQTAPAPNPAAPPQDPATTTAAAAPTTPAESPERTPASPRNSGEISGEGAGGLVDIWNNYRTTILAVAGIGLLCAGGLSFWKKRQDI